MVTIPESKTQQQATENSDRAAPQLTANIREITTQQLRPCSRCGKSRPLTHRVRSDLLEQIVCEICAAEAPLATRGIGALTVERIL